MAGETDEARPAVEPLRRMLDLAAVEGVDVDIEDLRAVERDLDLLAVDVDLLEIPLAHGPEVAVLGGDAVVEAAVILVGLEARLACRSLLFVVAIAVNDLEFEPVAGRVAAEWRPQGDAVVTRLGQLELDADRAVLERLFREQVAPLAGLADDGAIFDFIAIHGTLPVAEVLADIFDEAVGGAARKLAVGLIGRDLADEDVSPADLAPVGLQLDRPLGKGRVGHEAVGQLRCIGCRLAVLVGKEILQRCICDDDLAIEPDGDPFSDHADVEGVPFAERFVHPLEWKFALLALVVPEAA